MLISKKMYRADDYGYKVVNAFKQDIIHATFNIEVDGFFAENSILKFEAMKYKANQVVDKIEFLAKPNEKLHPHISLVTGFTDDMLNNAMSQKEAILAISNFLADTDAVIGFNSEADINYLQKKIPELSCKIHFDILEMLRDFFTPKDLKAYSPEEVFSWYDINDMSCPEALNVLLNSMLQQYISYFETIKPKKIKPIIRNLYYMVDLPKPLKLYINTDIGQFAFNVKNITYTLNRSNKINSLEDVDMEYLRQTIFKHFEIKNEKELHFLLLTKTEYKAILN